MPRREIYGDELGTYWFNAEQFPMDEALELVSEQEDVATSELEIRIVRGIETTRDGGPYFAPDPKGGIFWEVGYAE